MESNLKMSKANSHAKLSPSAAHIWMQCPGSVRMCEGLDEIQSEFAAEGTAAHIVAERLLRGQSVFVGQEIEGFIVDHEMMKGTSLYVDFVFREFRSDGFHIEERVDIGPLVSGMYGTCDTHSWCEANRTVRIADFKYGHVAVEVEDNPQLLSYALGIALRYHNRGIKTIELSVIQPRAPHPRGPIRSYTIDIVDLYQFAIALQTYAEATKDSNAPLRAGKHCRFCKAAGFCKELRSVVYYIVDATIINGVIVSMGDPKKYTSEELAVALNNRHLILNWMKALENFSHSEAMQGRIPPGYKLINKRSTRQWINPDVVISTLQALDVPNEDIFETSLRSPAQMEAKLADLDLSSLVKNVSSGTKLAPIDDPHSAVVLSENSGFEDRTHG